MTTNDALITLSEAGTTFADLKDAIKTASAISAKSGQPATLNLSKGIFNLKGLLSISSDVNLVGVNGSIVVLDSSTVITVKQGTFSATDLIITASSKSKQNTSFIQVLTEGIVNFTGCEFGPEDEETSNFGVSVKGKAKIKDSTFRKWSINAVDSGKVNITGSNFLGSENTSAVTAIGGAKLTLEECKFENLATAIDLNGKGSSSITSCKFSECCVSIKATEGANVKVTDCVISSPKACGLVVTSKAKLFVEDLEISSEEKNNSKGIEIFQGGVVDLKDLNINGLGDTCVSCSNEGLFKFDGFKAENNKKQVIFINNATVRGEKATFESKEKVIVVDIEESIFDIKTLQITGGSTGIKVVNSKQVNVATAKILNVHEQGFLFVDSSAFVQGAHISNKKTRAQGMKIEFKNSTESRITLSECKSQNCSDGIRVTQQKIIQSKQPTDDYAVQYETFDSNTMRNGKKQNMSKCELENCSFIACDIGFSIDGAKSTLKGCSFIMSTKHSIFMENESLISGGADIRKSSKLKIRWPNYVEPKIDNGSSLSNDSQLLTSVTLEKAFCGSADFEPLMYLPTLTERIRQAMNLFSSKENDCLAKSRVIMRSVNHMLVLLRTLADRLLKKELLDDPELGMFAASFKLYAPTAERKGKPTTLVTMESLFDSWKNLGRTRLFDKALNALNDAFRKEQVSGDLFDEWITPLEQMQRVCFVRSKYNRRRDYLLTTAKENPLSTWYFLDKEDPNTEEGQRLRSEVLKFLARDEDSNLQSKDNFHSSWVAQWAVNLLGVDFAVGNIPTDFALRRAWGDKLLDDKNPKKVIDEYKRIEGHAGYGTDMDKLMRFEAYVQHEKLVGKLTQDDILVLSGLFNGVGYDQAIKNAAKMFRGQGALPGYLTRIAEAASSPEDLLDALAHIHEDNASLSGRQKKEVTLAVMSHYYYPDSKLEPDVKRNTTGYVTCPMCLVQKLQPWNELKLENCKFDHRFCKTCFKNSMSTAASALWGTCAGKFEGENCTALATRREMEMAMMDKEKIYNILNTRIVANLRSIEGWKLCDSPGCIGGRSKVNKEYYKCRLCLKMITPDGGKSDPTVNIRLLKGLDGTKVARGQGVFRECYHCAVIYEKGNACSTITCSNCKKQFSMTWGPEHISHRFDEQGIGPQMYVPLEAGKLWAMGVFKTKAGKPLAKGAVLKDDEAVEVVRRAKVLLNKLDG